MPIPASHPFDFDPSYAMDLKQLRTVEPPAAPDGFDDFWGERYKRALRLDPQPQLTESTLRDKRWEVLDLTYRSTGDFIIGGWMLVPRNGSVERGLVVGHGYGGRDAPNLEIPVENTAVLFPCFRGMSRSARPPISPEPAWHVVHDIDKPARYIIGGCVEDLWVAVSVLESLYPRIAGKIGYSGLSFGGGIGGLAIPFDRRLDRGHLSLPTFGHQELRLRLRSTGSADAVQRHQARYGNTLPTLRLHDSAVAATRIKVPMLMSLALFDPAVAPPCQFAVGNALPPQNLNETFILDAGHFDYPDREAQEAALNERVREFFKVLMFPTRDGRFFEYEQLGIVGSLSAKVEAGHLQLYCVEGLAGETFYGTGHPAQRMARHTAFEEYVLNEVLPLMAARNPNDCTIVQGCSLGAFQAASLAFRHPHLFRKLVALSGRYDLTLKVESFGDLLDSHYDDAVYYATPSHFLPGLGCGWRLDRLRQMDIVLAIGQDDPFLGNNRHLSDVLVSKGIAHQMHVWDGRAHRAGPWRKMAALYI
eukprot:g9937.t1